MTQCVSTRVPSSTSSKTPSKDPQVNDGRHSVARQAKFRCSQTLKRLNAHEGQKGFRRATKAVRLTSFKDFREVELTCNPHLEYRRHAAEVVKLTVQEAADNYGFAAQVGVMAVLSPQQDRKNTTSVIRVIDTFSMTEHV